jgi:hypothetical protein
MLLRCCRFATFVLLQQPLQLRLLLFEVFYVVLQSTVQVFILFDFLKKKTISLYKNSGYVDVIALTRRICSRGQRKRRADWLTTSTDVITSQSHSPIAFKRSFYLLPHVFHYSLL